MESPQHRSAFTIVEMAMVLVIIGILSGVVLLAYNGIRGAAADEEARAHIQAATQAVAATIASSGSRQVPADGAEALAEAVQASTDRRTVALQPGQVLPVASDDPADAREATVGLWAEDGQVFLVGLGERRCYWIRHDPRLDAATFGDYYHVGEATDCGRTLAAGTEFHSTLDSAEKHQ